VNPGETPGLIVTSVVDSHVGRDVVITNNIGVSEEGVAARVVAAILEHKLLSPSSSPEFSDEQKAIAHRAIQSADAIVKANAAIVLGQPTEARAHLAAAAHVTDETFRYFTAMGNTFYFEQRFDESAIWFERAFQMPGHERDVVARANLALSLQQCRLGDIAFHCRRAIDLLAGTLSLMPVVSPDWGMTQNNLGVAWANLPTGDRGENVERAIACYEAALTVHTREAHPLAWAMTQNNLGVACVELPTGNRGENIQRAIACCEAALTVRTREAHPADWAWTQINLGIAWSELPMGNRGENLQRAIGHYEEALTVFSRETHTEEWLITQNNLALAHRLRADI
jgi:tetratricopeptide (TPR) repeat protein